MVRIESTLFCDGCGIEISLSPTIKDGRDYCCEDCGQGYQCKCGERLELQQQIRSDDDSLDTLPGRAVR